MAGEKPLAITFAEVLSAAATRADPSAMTIDAELTSRLTMPWASNMAG